jgi:hypothetical protein
MRRAADPQTSSVNITEQAAQRRQTPLAVLLGLMLALAELERVAVRRGSVGCSPWPWSRRAGAPGGNEDSFEDGDPGGAPTVL